MKPCNTVSWFSRRRGSLQRLSTVQSAGTLTKSVVMRPPRRVGADAQELLEGLADRLSRPGDDGRAGPHRESSTKKMSARRSGWNPIRMPAHNPPAYARSAWRARRGACSLKIWIAADTGIASSTRAATLCSRLFSRLGGIRRDDRRPNALASTRGSPARALAGTRCLHGISHRLTSIVAVVGDR